jgi:hypothetical protein
LRDHRAADAVISAEPDDFFIDADHAGLPAHDVLRHDQLRFFDHEQHRPRMMLGFFALPELMPERRRESLPAGDRELRQIDDHRSTGFGDGVRGERSGFLLQRDVAAQPAENRHVEPGTLAVGGEPQAVPIADRVENDDLTSSTSLPAAYVLPLPLRPMNAYV